MSLKKSEPKIESKINLEKEIDEEQKIKNFDTTILEVEDNSIIVNISGWRTRYYFDLSEKVLEDIRNNKKLYEGRKIKLEYQGDLEDVFTLVRLPIKKWFE